MLDEEGAGNHKAEDAIEADFQIAYQWVRPMVGNAF